MTLYILNYLSGLTMACCSGNNGGVTYMGIFHGMHRRLLANSHQCFDYPQTNALAINARGFIHEKWRAENQLGSGHRPQPAGYRFAENQSNSVIFIIRLEQMRLPIVSVAIAFVAGIATVYLLPAPWLATLATVAGIVCSLFGVIVMSGAKNEPPSNPKTAILLSIIGLPGDPFANVKEDWALASFLAFAAFLVSLGLSVIVRVNA